MTGATAAKIWGVAGCQVVELRSHSDARGGMTFVENGRDLPFDIARMYWLYGSQPGQLRGAHAHKALRQLYVAVAGRCEVVLRDPESSQRVVLDRPDRGLLLGPMVWRQVENISHDAVLLVAASEPYCEDDYLRDFAAYLAAARVQ